MEPVAVVEDGSSILFQLGVGGAFAVIVLALVGWFVLKLMQERNSGGQTPQPTPMAPNPTPVAHAVHDDILVRFLDDSLQVQRDILKAIGDMHGDHGKWMAVQEIHRLALVKKIDDMDTKITEDHDDMTSRLKELPGGS